MNKPVKPSITPCLKSVKQAIAHWRSSRQKVKPMPEELWQSAAEVARSSLVGKVAKELGLNYTALKNRVGQQQSKKSPAVVQETEFIELGVKELGIAGSCEVEIEKTNGSKLKLKFTPGMGVNIGELWVKFLEQP